MTLVLLATKRFSVLEELSNLNFSQRLDWLSKGCAEIDFSSTEVLDLIEDSVDKCRKRRAEKIFEEKIPLPKAVSTLPFKLLCTECDFYYDTSKFPLRDEILSLLEIPELPLESLHLQYRGI